MGIKDYRFLFGPYLDHVEESGLGGGRGKSVGKGPLDRLIAMDWDVVFDLQRASNAPNLSTEEMVKVANSLAYHANTLSKLLVQKGEKPIDQETLGSLIDKLPKKFRSKIVGRIKKWKTGKLSLSG